MPTTPLRFWSARWKNPLDGIEMPTLDQVPAGRRCRIQSLGGPPALIQRFLELGLLEGEELLVIGQAPLGDPLEIESPLTRLSLRRKEAAQVQVTLAD